MNDIRLVDLISSPMGTFRHVIRAMMYLHPGRSKKHEDHLVKFFRKTYNKVKKFQREEFKSISKREKIEIILVSESMNLEAEFEYMNEDFGQWRRTHTNLYSLSFRPWEEVANIPISKKTLNTLTVPEIIAEILYEMTWFGDEGIMQEKGKSLLESVQQAKKDIEAGKL